MTEFGAYMKRGEKTKVRPQSSMITLDVHFLMSQATNVGMQRYVRARALDCLQHLSQGCLLDDRKAGRTLEVGKILFGGNIVLD